MSSLKDKLKNKVRSSAHAYLIDSTESKEKFDNETVKTTRKKVRFEESHTRQTFYIDNDLLKKLNKLSKREKGKKTRIINEALKNYLNSDI